MSKVTPATRALVAASVPFTVHVYEYDADAESIGLQAASALGVDPARVLKTLMALVDGKPVCVVVPSDHPVRRVFAIARLEDQLQIVESKAEAQA